ncbi:M55 family metallopeptidase [Acrocarpospora sp. B8E8]|uniref:M55 family metallopeptidase n=1 Tax=Acrocarpospora sp. B8E8 TaxID=3153572 RepID=UPI00325CB8CE
MHATRAPASVPQPLRIEVDLHQPRAADLAAFLPGVTRSGRTVAFDAETIPAAYGMLQVIVALAQNGP